MGEGEDSSARSELPDAESAASEDEWPELSELELDVCVSDDVPGADLTDAETEDA